MSRTTSSARAGAPGAAGEREPEPPAGPLAERERELQTLAAAVTRLAATGRGGIVTLTAPAGLGKSALLARTEALATAAGCHVRRATPSPLERHFPFGAVRELLEAPLRAAGDDERAALLGADSLAGRLLLDGAAPGADATTAVAHSVARLCTALAAQAPLVLLVDDAHWADRSSLEVLCHLARRSADLPLLLVVAARGDDPDAPAALLDLLAHEAGAAALQPQPLTLRAGVRLLRGRLAPAAPLDICRRCHEAAAGNPWLLTELGHQLAAYGAAALDEAGAAGANSGAADTNHGAADANRGATGANSGAMDANRGAPVGERARTAVRRRLATLPAPARLLAAVLAVAGDGLPLALAGRVAGVPPTALGAARDALISAGLLTADGERLTHALVAAAIADELPRSERERLHRAAADGLLSDGAPPSAVAGHLLHCRPSGDATVSALLGAAAESAWRQGAPHSAVAYLERALEERAPGDERARLLALLATCSFDAGLPDARARLREALRASGDREVRHDVLRRMAALSLVDAGDRELERLLAVEQAAARDDGERLRLELIALDALVNVPDRQPERARRLDALLSAAAVLPPAAGAPFTTHPVRGSAAAHLTGHPARGSAAAIAPPVAGAPFTGRPAPPVVADPLSHRLLLAHRAWLAVERGSEPAERCAALALAAMEGGELRARARRDGAFHLCVRTLLLCDRLDDAARAIALLDADATALGSSRLRAAAAWFSAELALRAGRIGESEQQALLVLELLGPRADAFTRGAVELLLHAHAERGAVAEAQELLRAHGLDGDLGGGIGEAGVLHARARVALAAGELERCHADALAAGALRIAHGRDNPTWSPWRATAALALAQLGRRDEAAALAEDELMRAEPFGAPSAVLAAHHAAAVADPDDASRIARCSEALAWRPPTAAGGITCGDADDAAYTRGGAAAAGAGVIREAAAAPAAGALERIRLQLELGATLRASGRRVAAREQLQAALAGADAAGATPLAERARRELVASGLRPRRAQTEGADALTPRQREVCELAAAGVANRAIAARLFLSVKTVETHLASSYRKLGVETRDQLATALAPAR